MAVFEYKRMRLFLSVYSNSIDIKIKIIREQKMRQQFYMQFAMTSELNHFFYSFLLKYTPAHKKANVLGKGL